MKLESSVPKKTRRWRGPTVRRKKNKMVSDKNYVLEDLKSAYENPIQLKLHDIATITFSHSVEHGEPFEVRGKDLAFFAKRNVCGNIIGVMTENRFIIELVDIDVEKRDLQFYTLILHRCNLLKHIFQKKIRLADDAMEKSHKSEQDEWLVYFSTTVMQISAGAPIQEVPSWPRI